MSFIQQQRRDTPDKRTHFGTDKETGTRLRRVGFDGGIVEANQINFIDISSKVIYNYCKYLHGGGKWTIQVKRLLTQPCL